MKTFLIRLSMLTLSPRAANAAVYMNVAIQCDDDRKEHYAGTLVIGDKFEGRCYSTGDRYAIDGALFDIKLSLNDLVYCFTGDGQRIYAHFAKQPCNNSSFGGISAGVSDYPVAIEETTNYPARFELTKISNTPAYVGRIGHCSLKTQ